MDALRNVPELILEFITRQDYIAMYLGFIGLWWLWLGYRGLRMGNTRGFGWRSIDVASDAAAVAGRAWLAMGFAFFAAGFVLWFTA